MLTLCVSESQQHRQRCPMSSTSHTEQARAFLPVVSLMVSFPPRSPSLTCIRPGSLQVHVLRFAVAYEFFRTKLLSGNRAAVSTVIQLLLDKEGCSRSTTERCKILLLLTERSPEALGIRGHSQAASQLEIPESRTVNRETRPMIPT